jgi:hypothetical protein
MTAGDRSISATQDEVELARGACPALKKSAPSATTRSIPTRSHGTSRRIEQVLLSPDQFARFGDASPSNVLYGEVNSRYLRFLVSEVRRDMSATLHWRLKLDA